MLPVPAGPAFPTNAPGALQTIIAGTSGAAQTQTAVLIPPSATPTFTATPTRTPTFTPTPTSTFIYVIPKAATPTSKTSASDTAEASSDYACRLISQDPEDGTRINPGTSFDAVWEVRNIGSKKWDGASVDYVYVSGRKMHDQAAYDLTSTVQVGDSIDLIVDMTAPSKAGDYQTEWALRRSGNLFCHVTLEIVVK